MAFYLYESSSLEFSTYPNLEFIDDYNLNNDLILDEPKRNYQELNLNNKIGEEDHPQNQKNSENLFPKENNVSELQKNQYSKDDFEYYDLQKIIDLLEKFGIYNFTEHLKKLEPNEIQDILQDLVIILTSDNKKNIRNNKDFLKNKRERNEENNLEKRLKGRPKKNTPLKFTEGIHDKFCPDNIIRKIKTKTINTIRIYLNNKFKINIKDTDFQTTKNVIDLKSNRETVMNPISEFFKNSISTKNKNTESKKYNKELIEAIEKGNDPYKKYLIKKPLHYFLDNITLKNVDNNLKDFPNVGQIIKEITEKYQKNTKEDSLELSKYIIRFVFLLFNYERYLYSKEPRKRFNKK